MTKLSVIVNLRSSALIKRTIESLLEQSVKPFEILVIDQNSPGWLVDELGELPPCVRLIHSARPNASFSPKSWLSPV